jgi:hypothetical protein
MVKKVAKEAVAGVPETQAPKPVKAKKKAIKGNDDEKMIEPPPPTADVKAITSTEDVEES